MNDIARHYPNLVPSKGLGQAAGGEEASYYYADQLGQTHLRDYWKILLKRMRYMVAIFVGVVAIGMLYSFLSPTLYRARSTIKIEPQHPTVTGVAEMFPSQLESGGPYDYYQTQFALLKSEPLGARVIKNLNLEANRSFKDGRTGLTLGAIFQPFLDLFEFLLDSIFRIPGVKPHIAEKKPPAHELGVAPWLIWRYLSFLSVQPVRNTRLVEIVFNTPDPKLSQELATAHATSFIQMLLEYRFNLTQEARDFLGKKLAELREKVHKAEVELNRFRQQHGVVSFEKGENIVVDRLVDLNKELTKAKAERIQAESLYQMTRNKNTQHLAQVLNSPLIQQMKASLATLETERGRLLSIFTPEHPRIKELNQQISEARKTLSGEIGSIVQGIESSYASARAREESLEAEAKKQQEAALSLKEVGINYAVLNEEVVVNRGLYENVLKRLHETNVANDLAGSNVQIMQRASFPMAPASPNTMRAFVFSCVAGLVLALAFALFAEYMDFSVNTPQAVWSAVSLTTLGVVPHLRSLHERYHPGLSPGTAKRLQASKKSSHLLSRELVVERDHLSLIAESYRTIRAALLLSQAEQPPKVLLLTSPCPDEGKTVTTLNLGLALAHGGPRVLVIDADLRKGRCHRLLNVANQGGLANVLTGHLSLEKAIQETAVRNFYLLPRGALPPNPADLLMSQKMREVLRELRASFDFILIDSPPVIAVSDAAVLSAICDGVLVVFHGQKTTTPTARRAVERLESVGAPLLGVILNGIDFRDPDYADYRSYYPSYYASVRKESSAGFEQYHDRNRAESLVPGMEDAPGFEWNGSNGNRFVPQQFFDRMVLRLSEALGPTASTIVPDQVVVLRESIDSFPMSRVWELAQLVSQEIVDTPLKARFLRDMSREIRALQAT
jgi:polysaccharide biosynthesis transport protein